MPFVLNLGANGGGSGKAVVFTESITTQEYLRTLRLGMGLGDEEVTMFRGVNDHERTQQAYTRWQQEEGTRFLRGTKPSREGPSGLPWSTSSAHGGHRGSPHGGSISGRGI